MTKRLIEEWLPIAELGEESMRERRSMTALPPIHYLADRAGMKQPQLGRVCKAVTALMPDGRGAPW